MNDQNRFIGLDGLRAIFCVGIVLFHVNGTFNSVFSKLFWPVYKYGGYFGNYMFFMLSGFLMSYHYKERIISGSCNFYFFIYKRVVKLYPLYFLSNLVMVIFLIVSGGGVYKKKLCITFLMIATGWFEEDTPYNFPAWFICVLMLLYILYYAMISIVAKYQPKMYLILCIFLILWGALLEVLEWHIPFNYVNCGEGYMNFFAGVFLEESLRKSKKIKSLLFIYLLGAFVGILLIGFNLLPVDRRWIISLLCANFIIMAIYGEKVKKVLSLSLFQMIGKISLSIYLWHIPVVQWLNFFEKKVGLISVNSKLNFVIYMIILMAVSELSYLYIEKSSVNLMVKG